MKNDTFYESLDNIDEKYTSEAAEFAASRAEMKTQKDRALQMGCRRGVPRHRGHGVYRRFRGRRGSQGIRRRG